MDNKSGETVNILHYFIFPSALYNCRGKMIFFLILKIINLGYLKRMVILFILCCLEAPRSQITVIK